MIQVGEEEELRAPPTPMSWIFSYSTPIMSIPLFPGAPGGLGVKG